MRFGEDPDDEVFPKTTIFFACATLILENMGSENHLKGCVILRVVLRSTFLSGSFVQLVPRCSLASTGSPRPHSTYPVTQAPSSTPSAAPIPQRATTTSRTGCRSAAPSRARSWGPLLDAHRGVRPCPKTSPLRQRKCGLCASG